MMGQREVERPRSVSTELSGVDSEGVGEGKGGAGGWVVVFGGVPRESAAITS